MRHLTALAVLLLAGCSPERQAPPRTPAAEPQAAAAAPRPEPKPAAASTALAAEALDLRGTEPFWAAKVRGDTLTLIRPETPDVTVQAQATATGEARAWSGRTADGRSLTALVRAAECSDGMSDLRYPMSAEVSLSGVGEWKGCAQVPARRD